MGRVPWLRAVTLKLLRLLHIHWNNLASGLQNGTCDPWEALPAPPGQAVCGSSRRKAHTRPAARRGRERQAVPGLRAEQKQGATKAKGKAPQQIKGAKSEISWRITLAFVRLLH